MNLTIAYVTGRKDPKIEWFFDSLKRQAVDPQIIVIDLHSTRERRSAFCSKSPARNIIAGDENHCGSYEKILTYAPPKPNVWQGEHRLTKEDWFAMSNARNTALCLCDTDYIAYVDDLSVLMPGWLNAVKDAMAGGYNVAGAYRKVRNLVVENGEVKSYDPCSEDSRLALAKETVGPCSPEWLYGCSCAFPVEALLSIDGWPEMICDGMGFEDCLTGIVLGNAGHHLRYDKRMMTLESEDHHHIEPSLRREDYGQSPDDKSHRALQIAKASKTFENGFGDGGIRALRERVLSGEPFDIKRIPEHEWYTGKPLSEL